MTTARFSAPSARLSRVTAALLISCRQIGSRHRLAHAERGFQRARGRACTRRRDRGLGLWLGGRQERCGADRGRGGWARRESRQARARWLGDVTRAWTDGVRFARAVRNSAARRSWSVSVIGCCFDAARAWPRRLLRGFWGLRAAVLSSIHNGGARGGAWWAGGCRIRTIVISTVAVWAECRCRAVFVSKGALLLGCDGGVEPAGHALLSDDA